MRPKKVILCVDDSEQILSIRTFLLETRGYRIIPALSPGVALEILERSPQGTIDLMITDLLLPGMDGAELVRRAKQLHPLLPTLIVSGTVASLERATTADAFLPKGAATTAELLDRVRVLVARKRGPKKQMPLTPEAGKPVLLSSPPFANENEVKHAMAS